MKETDEELAKQLRIKIKEASEIIQKLKGWTVSIYGEGSYLYNYTAVLHSLRPDEVCISRNRKDEL